MVDTDQVENESNNKCKIVKGTPSLVLFPARTFYFRVSEDEYIIEIPKKGSYKGLDESFFNEDSGEFNLFEGDTFFSHELAKVMFASKKYPDLKFNEFFVPSIIRFKEKNIEVVGQIVEMLIPTAKD